MATYPRPQPPQRAPTPPPSMSEPHLEYEVVFQAPGVLEETGAPQVRQEGTVRVIQGPTHSTVQTLDDSTMVYAFLAASHVNVPLPPDQQVQKIQPNVFVLRTPGHEFKVTFAAHTQPELLTEFEKVLAWFTSYQGPPIGTTPGGVSGGVASRLSQAGDSGVAFVDKIAGKVSKRMDGFMDPKLEAARAAETKNVNIGGKATGAVLGTTRKVVGAGAGAANAVTEKASDVVGAVLANNPLMKGLRSGKEGSKRFRFHNTLTAGMVAVGKVYVAADERGRAIVSTAGENSAQVLQHRYGDQVAGAARDSTHIAVDSYRIFRFPAKFGASALIKGAAKASLADNAKIKQ